METLEKVVELADVYTPHADCVVVEVFSPEKTKSGIIVGETTRKELQSDTLNWKIVAVGPEVKNYKIGEYVIMNLMSARPVRVPLIYTDKDEIQHLQFREFEILGKVDKSFITAKTNTNTTIN